MAEEMTLAAALKLADQDSPLPSLAGPALKVLRRKIECLAQLLRDGRELMEDLNRTHLHQLAECARKIESLQGDAVQLPTCSKPGCVRRGFLPCRSFDCPLQPSAVAGEKSR